MADTTLPAGDGLLGRVIDGLGAPLDGRGPLEAVRPCTLAAPAGAAAHRPWATGIKAIDFYAPLARGATAALLASPGVGLVVGVCELIHRLADRHGGCAVFATLDGERTELAELAGQLRESGVERHTALVGGPRGATPEQRRQVVLMALTAAEELAGRGREVLLVLDDGLLTAATAGLLRGRARATGEGSLTLLLCFWRHPGPEPELDPEAAALLGAAETRLVFSRELAREGIWPAIDALASRSRLSGGEGLRAAEAARALLRGDAAAQGERGPERARKLLLFQGQPFFVAEPFTARPAEYVPPEVSAGAFAGIAAGAYDQIPAEALRFIGRPPA